MVLESTLVCLDNSEFMRNGDYAPSRIAAQADAVNLLCGAKTQSNPENTVGLMTLAGKVPKVLIAPTAELGKVLSAVHGIAIEGEQVDFAAGIQKAQLALKHRQNKNQRQRIVLFAGSPIETEQKDLVRSASHKKQNNKKRKKKFARGKTHCADSPFPNTTYYFHRLRLRRSSRRTTWRWIL